MSCIVPSSWFRIVACFSGISSLSLGLMSVDGRAQSLRFRSIQSNPQGEILIRLEVTPGKNYRLDGSTTLSNWTPLASKTAANSLLEFIEPISSGGPTRFYRALEVTGEAAAASDRFASAAPLTGTLATGKGSNVGATAEPGEPDHSWLDPGKSSVWWKWTAPSAGRATISLIGTYFETLLAVYSGTDLASLQPVAKNRRISKLISFEAEPGATYYIAVAGHFDTTGEIQLALQLTPATPGAAPKSVAASSIYLDETSNPNIPPRVIDVSSDGLTWKDRDNGSNDAVESGTVVEFNANNSVATLVLDSKRANETNAIGYVFNFDSTSTGSYRYSIDGVPSGNGRFANFRDTRTGLAPPSLARSVLQTIRTRTSIGTSGQRHMLTFGWAGDFHDSDGQEHSSGTYTYSGAASTATAKLAYTGPPDIAGDSYEMKLTFVTSTHGTYSSFYHRNDGATIEIDGDFVIEFLQ